MMTLACDLHGAHTTVLKKGGKKNNVYQPHSNNIHQLYNNGVALADSHFPNKNFFFQSLYKPGEVLSVPGG